MTNEEFTKYKRFITSTTICPICKHRIIECENEIHDLIYVKAKSGNHIFIHSSCMRKCLTI